jgi:hypothetical protein
MSESIKVVGIVVLMVVTILGLGFAIDKLAGPVNTWDFGPQLQFVSGTEYNIGEQGQVIAEARYANGTSALVNCSFSIWYPDKLPFIISELGNLSVSGASYVGFTVPNSTGVYEYQAQCDMEGAKTGVISKSFHVSEFQNDTSTKLNRVRAVMVK